MTKEKQKNLGIFSVVCLDLEGVLIPEIWINVASVTGIKKLNVTTRDIADYDELMGFRLNVLKEKNLTLTDIQKIIQTMQPLEGALDFLDTLRKKTQVIILSDTFSQFAAPLIEKLKQPTIFCHTLRVNDKDKITGYQLRQKDSKKASVLALKSLNFRVLAAGDSFNDLSMLKAADFGYLFRSPLTIQEKHPELPAISEYDDLYAQMAGYFK